MVTWERTPEKLKEFFIKLMGEEQTKQMYTAMHRGEWILIDGPHGPTGKTTLERVLRAIGYDRVAEVNYSTTIRLDQPIEDRREYAQIFEELGISEKY